MRHNSTFGKLLFLPECSSTEFKCTTGGGCIPLDQRCDGTLQCPDRSDEWNCIRLEEEINNKNILQVEVGNDTWVPICAQNWNQTYSDEVCHSLGFGSSSITETIVIVNNPNKHFLVLKPERVAEMSLLSQLEKSDNCDSVLSITCQEFCKF